MDVYIPKIPEIKSISEYAFDALVEEMSRFQSALADDVEVGIITNGAGQVIHVRQIRMRGQVVVFDGTDSDGRDARLIQHYTQVNVHMVAAKKLEAKPYRIGFQP